ncbi:MAG TPA: Gfo/Idh/MocA family oxidoreductase [Opitutaceae bacterium]
MNSPLPSAHRFSRREFCRTAAGAALALSAPLIIPSRLLGASSPSNRIRVGQIGSGRIAQAHDMTGVLKSGLADIVAVCDLDSKRAQDGRLLVEKHQRENNLTPYKVDTYGDYRELLARKDIDAVVISTPDHWHAEPALAAVQAGKDIYLQKPMTMTLVESLLLRESLMKSDRIFQLGSQQRSWTQFRQAVELVRSGRAGRLHHIEIGLPIDPTAPDDPEQSVPSNLDYERWLGPTAEKYYTEQRVHPQRDYSRPGWLRNDAYCLGMITGWGAHHYDIAHWGMDCELSGPSRIEATADFPPADRIWNVHGAYRVELTYPNNVIVTVSDKFPNGIRFIGDEGWIFVTRDGQATASDPSSPDAKLKPLDASDPRLLDPKGLTVQLPVSTEHHLNWLECVRSRKTPMVPAPIAHRSNTACIVSWVAMKLGRPLQWDAKTERFVNDAEANSMLARNERAPYGAVRLAGTLGLKTSVALSGT